MRFAEGAPWGFVIPQVVLVLFLLSVGLGRLIPIGEYDLLLGDVFLSVGLGGILWISLLVYFFRDPERSIGYGVVSPADGRVISVANDRAELRLTIFLGVLDVHVIRSPIAGQFRHGKHIKGARRFAFSKESDKNERYVLNIVGKGETCNLVLIAGAFADRILVYPKFDKDLEKGERVGVIKFGSRVDLAYAAESDCELKVAVGDRVIAGETTIILPKQKEGETEP